MLQNNYNFEGLEPEPTLIDPRRFGIPEGAGEPISTITGKPSLTDFGEPKEKGLYNLEGLKPDTPTWGEVLKKAPASGLAGVNVGLARLARDTIKLADMPASAVRKAFGIKGERPDVKFLEDYMVGEQKRQEVLDVSEKLSQLPHWHPKRIIGTGLQAVPQVAAVAGGALMGAPFIGGAESAATMLGAIAYGPSAEEAKAEGATEIQQILHGITSAQIEVLTELPVFRAVGQIWKHLKRAGIAKKAGIGFAKRLLTGLGLYGKGLALETVQEVEAYLGGQISKRLHYDPNATINFKDAVEAGYGGLSMAATVGIAGVPGMAVKLAGKAKATPTLPEIPPEVIDEPTISEEAMAEKPDIINMIDEGMTTGEINGEPFTSEIATGIIQEAYADKALADEDLDNFREKYPDLRPVVNDIIGENVKDKINAEMEAVEKAEIEAEEAYRKTPEYRQKLEAKMPTPTPEKTKIALEEVGVEIPDFKTTGEAYAFGEKATPEQVKELQRLVKVQDTKFNELKKAGKLQEAMDEAIKHQFYNEALQKVEGTEQYKKFKPEKAVKPMHELTLDEFEKAGHSPWEITQSQWVNMQRTHRKSLGQAEESGTPAAPFGDIEQFHRQEVEQARKEGLPVPENVIAEYEKAVTGEKVGKAGVETKSAEQWNKQLTQDETFYEDTMKDAKSMGVSFGVGRDAYITAKTDIDGLSTKYPFMSVRVKDVNGNRATIDIANFAKLSKEPAFTDRIRGALLYPKHSPEEKQSGFMDNIFEIGKSKLLPSKRKAKIEPIKPIDGIKFINNSTVTPAKQTEFIEALKDLRVRAHLTKYGVKEFIIEPPYKFELSGQANIDKKNHTIRVNADATNIINSVLHEIGHVDYDSLSKEQQSVWGTILAGLDNKAVNGYKKLNLPEEAYAETFAHQGEKWADEALAGAKPRPPNIEKPKPKLPRTEDLEGEGIGEGTSKRPKVEVGGKFYVPENKSSIEITKDYGKGTPKEDYPGMYRMDMSGWVEVTDLETGDKFPITRNDLVELGIEPTKAKKPEKEKVEVTPEKPKPFNIVQATKKILPDDSDVHLDGEQLSIYPSAVVNSKAINTKISKILTDRQLHASIKSVKIFNPEISEVAEKEKIETKTTPEGKEISVDLTKKEEAAVTPKQQKEYLLAEIDKAIEAEAKKIIDVNPNANLKDTINLLGKGELVGTSEQYTFTVPNDGEFEIYGSNLPEFQRRVKSAFPSTITSKKFKPKAEARKAVPTAKYNKILGKAAKDLKPADIDRIFKEVADTEARDITGAVLLNPFQNWLLSQDITKAVRNKIKSVAGKDYMDEAFKEIEAKDLEYAKHMVEHTGTLMAELQAYRDGDFTLKQIAKETGIKRSGNELTRDLQDAKYAHANAVRHLEKLGKPTDVSEGRAIEYIPSQEKHIKRYVPITRKEADNLFDKGAASLVARFNVHGPETTGEEGYYMRSPDRKAVGYSYSEEVIDLYEKYKERHGGTESGVSITSGKTKQRDGRLPSGVRDEKAFATKATKPQETITRKDLRKIFKRMKHIRTGQDSDGNLWFKAEGRPKITIFELDNITGHLNTSAGQIPVGSYLRDTIELKTGGEGHTADISTAYHELHHWLEKQQLLSANDITALNRVIAKDKGISASAVTEEHRAYYVGDNISAWETQKHPRIRRILRKLTDFMNAIYDFAAQAGWVKGRERTAEGVIRDIESGRILKEKKEALAGVNEFAQAVSFSLKKAVKAVTDNPNFVRWFGDSKVLNKDGSPMVVYHGTDKDFTVFREGAFDVGIHLGTAEQASDRLEFKAGEDITLPKQAILPLYARMENPLALKTDPGLFDFANFPWALDELDEFTKKEINSLKNYESEDYRLEDELSEGQNLLYARKELMDRFRQDVQLLLNKHGYDGIKYWNTGEIKGMAAIVRRLNATESKTELSDIYEEKVQLEKTGGDWSYVAFDPTQIKSIYNTGAFGITEPDIMFATKPTKNYRAMLRKYQEAHTIIDKSLKDIPPQKPPKLPSEYEQGKDSWFGNKDWAEVRNAIERGKLQDVIRDTVSVKKNIFGKKIFDRKSRDVDAAIHLYLDLKRNPAHRAEFYKDLPSEWKKVVDKIDLIEATPELKAIADHIREQGDATGKMALKADVIRNQIENHVNRLWKKRAGVSEKVYTDALQKFKTKSRHAKHRVFDTILEGLALKDKNRKHIFDLQIRGATSNLQTLKDEISRVIEDKKLITEMRKMKTEDGDPLLSTHRVNDTDVKIEHPNFKVWEFATNVDLIERVIDKATGLAAGDKVRIAGGKGIGKVVDINDTEITVSFKIEGSEELREIPIDPEGGLIGVTRVRPKGINFFITDEGTVLEKRELYAPEKIARDLNKIIGVSRLKGVRVLGVPAIDILTKYNAIFKSWILVTSFFHHQAFLRSYYLPSQHKTRAEWNPFKAYKMGKEAIEDMKPELELLVRNGLTMFKTQDWEESILRREDTVFGKILDKNTTSKAIKDKINELRERQANFLFGNFGAALKTQAALIELRNMTRKYPDMDVQERAKMVARLINDDFGGLHHGRMGRDPTIQHIMRLGLLAPDWTESNVRTMVKALKSPGGPEETAMYRRFWTSAITKGLSAVFVANILMAAFDDDDFEKRYKKAWKAGHHRWLDIDITPVYKMFGGKTEAKKYFSLFGHFRDPLKFMVHPIRSLHHKGSVVYGTFHEAMSGVDWKGQRFTTLSELIGVDDKGVYLTTTKTHKAGDPKGGKLAGKLVTYGAKGPISLGQMPSYIASQLIGVQPIQVQNLIAMLTGEVAAFDGIARSLGMHTGTTYPTAKSIREDFIEEYISLKKERKSIAGLLKKVRKYNLKHKEETIKWQSIIKSANKKLEIERHRRK